MISFNETLLELVIKDGRYAYEAYEFLFQALHFTQQTLGKLPANDLLAADAEPRHHVSGRELLEGICGLAVREFGFLAPTVFRMWGIGKTIDFGNIVFNLVDAGLMSKTPEDRLEDFQNVFDLERTLREGFRIQLDEAR